MLTPSAKRWHTSSDSMKPYEANIQSKMLGCQPLLSRAIVLTVLCQYHTDNWGNYYLSIGESYGLKTLTYPQDFT